MEATLTRRNMKTTKERILDAALELMAQYGYNGASMRKIAKIVGVRESAIYNHFKNKEEIYAHILQNLFTTPFDDFFEKKPPQEYAKLGKRYLLEYVAAFKLLSFDAKYEKLFRIILVELMQKEEIRQKFLEIFYRDSIKKLSNVFFMMMQEGLIRSADPILMAQEFFATLLYHRIHITLLRVDEKSTQQLSTIFEKHVDFFWEGVALRVASDQ